MKAGSSLRTGAGAVFTDTAGAGADWAFAPPFHSRAATVSATKNRHTCLRVKLSPSVILAAPASYGDGESWQVESAAATLKAGQPKRFIRSVAATSWARMPGSIAE